MWYMRTCMHAYTASEIAHLTEQYQIDVVGSHSQRVDEAAHACMHTYEQVGSHSQRVHEAAHACMHTYEQVGSHSQRVHLTMQRDEAQVGSQPTLS